MIPLPKFRYIICAAIFVFLILAGAWLNHRMQTGFIKGSAGYTDHYQIKSSGAVDPAPATNFRPREYIKIRRTTLEN